MGNAFLDQPITAKSSSWAENDLLKHSVCAMQGWRMFMEDAHIALNELPGHPTVGLFAVFDGHGGGEIARFCANHFVEQLLKRPSFSKGQFGEALKETFIQLELMLKMKPAIQELIKLKEQITKQKTTAEGLEAGTTVNVVLITQDTIICANAGDSRAALCRKEECVALSFDHKPENVIEKDRIEKTGVPIIEGRVNGLNLTRSIGDFKHKTVPGLAFNKQPVICVPDVTEVERKENDEFVLLACDGLWEAYGDDHVKLTKYFQLQLQKSHALDALKNFFDKNLSKNKTIGPYGKDNMTGIIIELKKLRK